MRSLALPMRNFEVNSKFRMCESNSYIRFTISKSMEIIHASYDFIGSARSVEVHQ